MIVIHYGIDFPHEKGEFCLRKVAPYYLLSCFSTDFLYEKEGLLLRGNAGDLLIMEPGMPVYHGPLAADEIFINDWINIAGEDFTELLERYPVPLNQPFFIQNQNIVKNCIEKIMDELLFKQTGFEEKINCCLTDTMIDIHRLYERTHHSHNQLRLESAREIFLRHPEKNWSLKEMAFSCGYSVSRFSALYAEQFGCSPKADLINARIEQAKQLLHYSSLSITEIAERCGFHSIYYFSKYFKETVGMSPSDYAHKQFEVVRHL